MNDYDTLQDGIALHVRQGENEVQRYMTVTDKLTGQEFSGNYPRSMDWDWILDTIVTQAVAEGNM